MQDSLVGHCSKRGDNIKTFEEIFSYDNLYRSYEKSCKGVKWKSSTQRLIANAPLEVYKIYESLQNGKFKSKGTAKFTTTERGKAREIEAPHITERIVQKCLCNYGLWPELEKGLIYDNGASQKGKGDDFVKKRIDKHLRHHYLRHGTVGGVLRFDFKGYFSNIPHAVVFSQIDKTNLDEKTKDLAKYLIKQNQGDTGLGIGAEISQVFGITYANRVDHLIKDKLGVKCYARYMDDGYLIHPDINYLKFCLKEIEKEAEKIGGTFNKKKTQITRLSDGFEFLKIRYFLTDTGKIIKKPNKEKITRMRRKLKKLKKKVDEGQITKQDAEQSYRSWKSTIKDCNAHQSIQSMDKLYKQLFGCQN